MSYLLSLYGIFCILITLYSTNGRSLKENSLVAFEDLWTSRILNIQEDKYDDKAVENNDVYPDYAYDTIRYHPMYSSFTEYLKILQIMVQLEILSEEDYVEEEHMVPSVTWGRADTKMLRNTVHKRDWLSVNAPLGTLSEMLQIKERKPQLQMANVLRLGRKK